MINFKSLNLKKALILVGSVLLAAALLLLCLWQWGINSSAKRLKETVEEICSIIPAPTGAVLEEKLENTMPTLSVNKTDFIGLLEMPRFGLVLPVANNFENTTKHPCKFSGSAYTKNLIIGATTQKGQFDFFREISVGDTLFFTDMQGSRYTYSVTDLRFVKHADQAALTYKDAAITLFIKNIYSFEYLIVSLN